MNLFFVLPIVLIVLTLFVLGVKRLRLPSVLGLILGGLVLGMPPIKTLIIEPHTEFIFFLGDAGLLCLMFLAGFESSWKKIYHEKKDSLAISFFAALTPFFLGFLLFKLLGFSTITAVVVGIGMSITAEATIADILLDMGQLKTKVGSAMMGAGIIDDVLGFLAFILLTYLLEIEGAGGCVFLLSVIGAFFLGILAGAFLEKENHVIQSIRKALMWIVVPFFFLSVGLHFEFSSLVISPLFLFLIIVVALVGKIGGSLLAKSFTDLSWKQLHLIGWAMNSRGAIEMALALIALRAGLLSSELYSGLVIMALVTTLVFPLVMNRMIRKDPQIME